MATVTKEEIEAMEEALPLTVGDGSEYRTDVDDRGVRKINKEKIVKGMQFAVSQYKPELPKLSGAGFEKFIESIKAVTEEYLPQYSSDDIKKVNPGGIVGNIANMMIKDKYGGKQH